MQSFFFTFFRYFQAINCKEIFPIIFSPTRGRAPASFFPLFLAALSLSFFNPRWEFGFRQMRCYIAIWIIGPNLRFLLCVCSKQKNGKEIFLTKWQGNFSSQIWEGDFVNKTEVNFPSQKWEGKFLNKNGKDIFQPKYEKDLVFKKQKNTLI